MSVESTGPVRSPLHADHERLGARFAEFGGWLMPLEYTTGGVLAEHRAVREAVGVFDVSHLGKVRVSGAGAKTWLDTVLAADLGRVPVGVAQYQLLCTEQGGVVDDLIACPRADDDVLLVPNAANCASVAKILAAGAPAGVRVDDEHQRHAIIAVQGPASADLLDSLGLPVDLDYMSFTQTHLGDVAITVSRSGYTGERGYELILDPERASGVWLAILAAGVPFGVRPCGLAARDTLRTEMGYPLHGHELSTSIDPLSAGLGWAVGWDKPDFHGARALRRIRAKGPARRLRGLRASGRGIPRPGMDCVDLDQQPDAPIIGKVSSGTYSPSLRTGIGLAFLDASVATGQHVGVLVRGRTEEFEVVKLPFRPSAVR